jgi:hypothetical protein
VFKQWKDSSMSLRSCCWIKNSEVSLWQRIRHAADPTGCASIKE